MSVRYIVLHLFFTLLSVLIGLCVFVLIVGLLICGIYKHQFCLPRTQNNYQTESLNQSSIQNQVNIQKFYRGASILCEWKNNSHMMEFIKESSSIPKNYTVYLFSFGLIKEKLIEGNYIGFCPCYKSNETKNTTTKLIYCRNCNVCDDYCFEINKSLNSSADLKNSTSMLHNKTSLESTQGTSFWKDTLLGRFLSLVYVKVTGFFSKKK